MQAATFQINPVTGSNQFGTYPVLRPESIQTPLEQAATVIHDRWASTVNKPQAQEQAAENQNKNGSGLLEELETEVKNKFEQDATDLQYDLMPAKVKQKMEMIKKGQRYLEVISIASIIASVVFASIAVLTTGNSLTLPLFLAGGLLLYIGYNGLQVSRNLTPIIRSPITFISFNIPVKLNIQKIKDTLELNTEWTFRRLLNKGIDFALKDTI